LVTLVIRQLPSHRQFAAWDEALSSSHLIWSLGRVPSRPFAADMAMRTLGPIRIIRCSCEPCGGIRTEQEIAKTDDAFFGLLLVEEGDEVITQAGREAILGPGRWLLWDSTRPMTFQVHSDLRKATLLIQQQQLRARLPEIDHFVCESVDASRGLNAIVASHVAALANQILDIESAQGDHLIDLTLELIATCLEARAVRPATRARTALLADIKSFIERHLDNPRSDHRRSPTNVASPCATCTYSSPTLGPRSHVGSSIAVWSAAAPSWHAAAPTTATSPTWPFAGPSTTSAISAEPSRAISGYRQANIGGCTAASTMK